MSTSVYLGDEDFDLLVRALHSVMTCDRSESIGQWEIRLTLGGHGVLPASIKGGPEPVDRLVEALRSVSAPRPTAQKPAALRVA